MLNETPHPVAADGTIVPVPSPSAEPAHTTAMFQDQSVRFVTIDGTPWMAAADICRALKLPIGQKASLAKHIAFLAEEDKDHAVLPTPSGRQRCAIITLEGAQTLTRKRKTRLNQQVRAWVGREATKLVSKPTPAPVEPEPAGPPVLLPEGTFVLFKGKPIRFARVSGLVHYSAQDVCDVLGLRVGPTLDTKVAEAHKRLASLSTPDGQETGPVLSPIGVWTLTLYLNTSDDFAFQRWVWTETKLLQAEAFDRERYGAAQCMALRPDGDVPPRPHPRSGRVDEWTALKWRKDYISPRMRMQQAMFQAVREGKTY